MLSKFLIKKWVHKTESLPNMLKEAEDLINKLGEEGWELVQICPPCNDDRCVAYFKRPYRW